MWLGGAGRLGSGWREEAARGVVQTVRRQYPAGGTQKALAWLE